MPIIVNVDVMLAKRKMSSGELAEKVGITQANLSILKTGKAKAVIPTFSASSPEDIFLFASITSMFTIIGMIPPYLDC